MCLNGLNATFLNVIDNANISFFSGVLTFDAVVICLLLLYAILNINSMTFLRQEIFTCITTYEGRELINGKNRKI